jgi:hypothetical protein
MIRSPFNYRTYATARLSVLLFLAVMAGVTVGAVALLRPLVHDPSSRSAVTAASALIKATAATCTVPTPTTAAGYAAMFAAVPTSQWGGADVSISVRVGGTNVWLWGDTISSVTSWSPFAGRFVHSSAIAQNYGCTHVSHAGAQLLPNDSDGTWYWIKAAAAAAAADSTHLRITADHVQRTGSGAWDFAVIGERTATAVLDVNGDVTFQSWTGAPVAPQHVVQKDGAYPPWSSTVSEISDGKVLASNLPHSTAHFSYAPFIHSGTVRLASGKVLLTVCTNSTPLASYAGYRPLFFEVTL